MPFLCLPRMFSPSPLPLQLLLSFQDPNRTAPPLLSPLWPLQFTLIFLPYLLYLIKYWSHRMVSSSCVGCSNFPPESVCKPAPWRYPFLHSYCAHLRGWRRSSTGADGGTGVWDNERVHRHAPYPAHEVCEEEHVGEEGGPSDEVADAKAAVVGRHAQQHPQQWLHGHCPPSLE